MSDFRNELECLINRHSKENGSNTPDFILAEYLDDCLSAFDKAHISSVKWHSAHDKADDAFINNVLISELPTDFKHFNSAEEFCPDCGGPCRRRPRHGEGMNI